MKWPIWWEWELEFSSHLLKRMLDRGFNEVDLRLMLDRASGYHEDAVPGRWAVETMHQRLSWEVVVEPLFEESVLLVVTAYQVEELG